MGGREHLETEAPAASRPVEYDAPLCRCFSAAALFLFLHQHLSYSCINTLPSVLSVPLRAGSLSYLSSTLSTFPLLFCPSIGHQITLFTTTRSTRPTFTDSHTAELGKHAHSTTFNSSTFLNSSTFQHVICLKILCSCPTGFLLTYAGSSYPVSRISVFCRVFRHRSRSSESALIDLYRLTGTLSRCSVVQC